MMLAMLLAATTLVSSPHGVCSPDDVLEVLAAKCNSLKHFQAHYHAVNAKGDAADLTLYYERPDRAAIRFETPKGTQRCWVVDGRLCIATNIDGEDASFGDIDMSEILDEAETIDAVLREEFAEAPGPATTELGAGPFFSFQQEGVTDTDDGRLNATVGYNSARSSIFSWIDALQRVTAEPKDVGETWEWELDDGMLMVVSKDTGILTRMCRASARDSESGLVLLSIDLESDIDAEEFDVPSGPRDGVKSVSADMRRQMRVEHLQRERLRIWGVLADGIERKQMAWDEEAPAKVRRVFRKLHSCMIDCILSGWASEQREWCDKMGEYLEHLPSDDADQVAKIEAERDRALEKLTVSLDRGGEHYGVLSVPDSFPGSDELAQSLLEQDREASAAEYFALIREPVLTYYRERTDKALGR